MRIAVACLLVVGFVACRSAASPEKAGKQGETTKSTPAVKPQVVVVKKDGTRRAVAVELAIEDAEKQRGLMYRRELRRDDGMLFFFDDQTVHPFWMHNTLIPLDMIHLDSTGKIVGIVREAPPQTDD